jgi:CRISPR-associated protein Csb1
VRSIIRAWDVDQLHSAAQFNSVWKALHEDDQKALEEVATKINKAKPNEPLSKKGLKDAPAVTYKDGRRVLGGILVRGSIERHVTINLVALRGIVGANEEDTPALRKYLLALSLLTATTDIDMFLREGCNLRIADANDEWRIVPRRGNKQPVDLSSNDARTLLNKYAQSAYKPFEKAWDELGLDTEHEFDLKAAKDLLGKTTDEEEEKP